jgi:diguanylate cyclase (GGDEF)-like protein
MPPAGSAPVRPSGPLARLVVAARRIDAALPIGMKLVLPMFVIAAAGGGILALTVYRSEANRIHNDYEARAFLVSADVRGAVVAHRLSDPVKGDYTGLQNHIDSLVGLEPSILRIDLLEVNGRAATTVASSDHSRINMFENDAADLGDELRALRSSDLISHDDMIGDTPALHVTVPFNRSGHSPFVVAVHLSAVERDRALAALLRNFVLGVGSTIVLATVALLIGVHTLISRRITLVLGAADCLQTGDFSARVKHPGLVDARDEMLRLGSRFNDMASSIQDLHAQLERAATVDALTGLYNRRHAMEALTREVAQARRLGHPLAVVMLDLDGLKQINDRWGHQAGDAAIRQVAGAIRHALRTGDVPARLGGDEFVAILPGCGIDTLEPLLRRIHDAHAHASSAESVTDDGAAPAAAHATTLSAGAAVLAGTDDADSLLQRADAALYDAKRAGKNRSRIAA